MNKEGGTQFLRGFPDNIKRPMIQVSAFCAMTMFVWIDMCTDFDAAQTKLAHATFEFLRGQIDILQGDRPETDEATWIFPDDFYDVIV
jgi:hypothetical protein